MQRACLSRPWLRLPGTARRPFSRVGPRLIRVRLRGSCSTRETATPSCSCATSQPRFTESSRSRPRCSTRCPAQGDPPGRNASRVSGALWPHSSVPWCSCSTICTSSPIRPVWTCSRSSSSTFRPARRSRSRAGRSRHCRLPAGGRTGRSTRSAWRTSGSTSRRPRCCWELPESSSMRGELSDLTERTEGWPAGLYLAALSMQTGAAGSLGWRGLQRRRPVRVRVLPRRASLTPAGRGSDLPQVHIGAGAYVRRALRCGAPDDGVGRHARRARARERLRRATGPAARVVSLPPPVRSAAAERARAERAGPGGRAEPSCDGLVHRQRPDARKRSSTGRLRARRAPSPTWSRAFSCRSTSTAGMQTAERVVRVVRRGRAGAASCTRRLRSVDPRTDRAARQMPSGCWLSQTGRPRQALWRMAAPRSSRGSQPCART